MKKILIIIFLGSTSLFISGNTIDEHKIDTNLKRYDTLMKLSRELPFSQQELIKTWIQNDVVIRINCDYYNNMTANSQP